MPGFDLEDYFSWVSVLRGSSLIVRSEIEGLSQSFEAPERDQLSSLDHSVAQIGMRIAESICENQYLREQTFSELALLLRESLYLFQGKMKEIQGSTDGDVAESLLALMNNEECEPEQGASSFSQRFFAVEVIRWERLYLRAVALSRLNPQSPFEACGNAYLSITDGDLWQRLAKISSSSQWKNVSARCEIQLGFLLMHRCAFSKAQIKAQRASSLGVDLDQYSRALMNNLQFTCAIHLFQEEIAKASLSLLRKLGNATPSQRLADLNRLVSFHIAFDRLQSAAAELQRFEQLPAGRSSYSAISYALLLKNKIVLQLSMGQVGIANELLLNLFEHLRESGLSAGFLELYFEQAAILYLDENLDECVEFSRKALVRAEGARNELLKLQALFFLVACGQKGFDPLAKWDPLSLLNSRIRAGCFLP